jgi:hypothetical protein
MSLDLVKPKSVELVFTASLLSTTDAVGGCRGPDRMVVGFITTYAISAYHH